MAPGVGIGRHDLRSPRNRRSQKDQAISGRDHPRAHAARSTFTRSTVWRAPRVTPWIVPSSNVPVASIRPHGGTARSGVAFADPDRRARDLVRSRNVPDLHCAPSTSTGPPPAQPWIRSRQGQRPCEPTRSTTASLAERDQVARVAQAPTPRTTRPPLTESRSPPTRPRAAATSNKITASISSIRWSRRRQHPVYEERVRSSPIEERRSEFQRCSGRCRPSRLRAPPQGGSSRRSDRPLRRAARCRSRSASASPPPGSATERRSA